jgi:PIN domain nuclease of toxin-antitoxin system
MLIDRGRLSIPLNIDQWMQQALRYSGVHLLPLTPEIAIESTQLPGSFQRDPADRIIVATARRLRCPLVTLDQRIQSYAHVQVAP